MAVKSNIFELPKSMFLTIWKVNSYEYEKFRNDDRKHVSTQKVLEVDHSAFYLCRTEDFVIIRKQCFQTQRKKVGYLKLLMLQKYQGSTLVVRNLKINYSRAWNNI